MAENHTRITRNVFIACLYILSALWGARLVASPPDPFLDLAFEVMIAVAVAVACIYDSRLVGKPIPRSLQWLVLFAWPIAAPVYLISSRGVRGLFIAAMHAILLYAALLGAYYGTAAAYSAVSFLIRLRSTQ